MAAQYAHTSRSACNPLISTDIVKLENVGRRDHLFNSNGGGYLRMARSIWQACGAGVVARTWRLAAAIPFAPSGAAIST